MYYQSICSLQNYQQSPQGGLRRTKIFHSNEIETSIVDNNKTLEEGEYGKDSVAEKLSDSVNEIVEEEKYKLFGICEVIQLKNALERISKIVRHIETNSGEPSDLLDEYQQCAWPILIETDTQIKLLSSTVRHTIDSCSLNERCLGWLLEIHKFQVSIEEMISAITTVINDDIERVLMLQIRCGPGGIIGLYLSKETIELIEKMKQEICDKIFKE